MAYMGAICGILDLNEKSTYDRNTIREMLDIMRCRGPGRTGKYSDRYITLACRQLRTHYHKQASALWSNQEGSIQLMLDGEIIIKGQSDKVDNGLLIKMYEESGPSFMAKLDGSFTLALWDSDKRTLMLAKDRFGTKPLYYAVLDGYFVFASQIKSLMAHPGFRKQIDAFALRYCLQYWYTQTPTTIFHNVRKVNPASHVIVQNTRISETKYWDLRLTPRHQSQVYYSQNILRILDQSIRNRASEDFQPGVLLSGGIDSSALVALMSKMSVEPIKTYSVGFEEKGYYNELRYARIVADRFKTDHHEVLLTSEVIQTTPQTIWHMEYPTGIPNLNLNFHAYRKASEKNRVILVGDGADELFAPDIVRRVYLMSKLGVVPGSLRHRLAQSAQIFQSKSRYLDYFGAYIKLAHTPGRLFFKEKQKFSDEDLRGPGKDNLTVYSKEKMKIYDRLIAKSTSDSLFDRLQYSICKTYFTNMVLELVDRMGMAFSIEKRYPFLSNELVRLVSMLPVRYKLRGYEHKYLLQKAVRGILPATIINRRKEPFLPMPNLWVRDQKDIITHFVSEFKNRRLVRDSFIDRLLEYRNLRQTSDKLWTLFAAELWFRMYIDNNPGKMQNTSLKKLW